MNNSQVSPPQNDTQNTTPKSAPPIRSIGMKRYLIIAVLLIVAVFGGYLGYQKYSSSNFINKQRFSTSDWQLLDVVLTIDAPFSRSALVINNQGKTLYVALEGEQEVAKEETTTPLEKVKEIEKLIMKNNFRSMKDMSKKDNDPEGGSTYTIVLGGKKQGKAEGDDAFVHRVSCYDASCEPKFLEIKDKIIEAWGKELLETGV